MAEPSICMFPATMLPRVGDSITITVGSGVLVGASGIGGKTATDVGGSCDCVVGNVSGVMGNVVGTPLVGKSVRVGWDALVGALVIVSICSSGAPPRLQALIMHISVSRRNTMNILFALVG